MRTHVLAASAFFLTISAHAAPPYDGTVWIDADVIVTTDTTTFVDHLPPTGRGVQHTGNHPRLMMHARNPDRWSTLNAHIYHAWYGAGMDSQSGLMIELQVNPVFAEARARELPERYARMVGQLPAVLREAVDEIEINPGDYSASGFHRGWACGIYLYVDMMEAEWNRPFAEEIILHEAAHCLEDEHPNTAGWRDAQDADAEFISEHAASQPHREDFAETFSAWTAVRYTPDCLDDSDRTLIASAIPSRIAYLDEAISDDDMQPFERSDMSDGYFIPFFAAADSTAIGFMRIVNRSDRAGTVSIVAIDDTGESYAPVTLDIGAREARHFNARDLERGNPDMGLHGHVGNRPGNWCLTLTTTLDIVPLAFTRGPDGMIVPVTVIVE